ncbi:MAG: two component, sigma54 specific, transcriptional regulator, Fis family [Myxococcaceae bacterium]|nr:two component, sigma54 specific, transcriptional regulator, Fis family [Myxococcaceae bacterium]
MTAETNKVMTRILVVDDEQNAREALRTILSEEGFEVAEAADGEEGLKQIQEFHPSAVLCDVRMPKLDGISLLRRARDLGSDSSFIMMTAFASIEQAVEAMRIGAEGYLVKPIEITAVLAAVEKAVEKRRLRQDVQLLSDRLGKKQQYTNIVGESPELHSVFDVIKRAAPTRATVLILGESGTGKELIAQAIHEESTRRDKPFVKVNCAALSESLLESELFGHEKGSFTGAIGRREGRFELANGGTLFLDEIGDISSGMQVKLLRVLQQHEFERVGGTQTVKVDVRLVAATNKDLEGAVRAGKFREDLFYRLNVVSVTLPPLRQRKSDIPLLVSFFIQKYCAEHEKKITGLAPGTLNALLSYNWPGNVRELSNVVERGVVLSHSEILNSDDLAPSSASARAETKTAGLLPGAPLNVIEREAILKTLELVGGSTSQAAEVLGISVRKIQYKLKEYAAIAASTASTLPQ